MNVKSLFAISVLTGLIVIIYMACFPAQLSDYEDANSMIVKQSGGSALLIAECADEEYIESNADWIIDGSVNKVETRWNKNKTSIITCSDILIDKYVKGTPFYSKKLQIQTPGGTIGNVSQWVEDQPIFKEGERLRIYLQKINGELFIFCGQCGVEEIE